MGRLFLEYVDDDVGARFCCKHCSSDIASETSLLWEGFMGACTPALLFRGGVNLSPCSAKREEVLSTGKYVIQDIQCHICCSVLGWKYLEAQQEDQQYKVGAVLLQQGALERINNLQAVSRSLRLQQQLQQQLRDDGSMRAASRPARAQEQFREAAGWMRSEGLLPLE